MLATILALTAMDYDHLARTIQVEAAKGTMDEYCVAVSVLNRVRSPKFPNTVASVVYASGQYEGFTKWRPVANPALVNRLRSKEGQLNSLPHTTSSEIEQTLRVKVNLDIGLPQKIRCVIIRGTSTTTTGSHDQTNLVQVIHSKT